MGPDHVLVNEAAGEPFRLSGVPPLTRGADYVEPLWALGKSLGGVPCPAWTFPVLLPT